MRLDKLQVYSSLFDMLRIPQKNRLEIYDCFWRFDKDGSGSIDFREFANSFEIQKTAFAKRAFMMLDTGGTGEINFAQFVVACWNYCTYDKVGLASFAYFLYDPQRKGAIEIPEMFALLEDVYGLSKRGATMDAEGTVNVVKNSPEYYIIQSKRGLKQCAGADELISMTEFVQYCRTHPNILTRPFTIQSKLQKKLGGATFWEKLTKERRAMEKSVGAGGINILDADQVISWLEREGGIDLRTGQKRIRPVTKNTPGAVKHGSGRSKSMSGDEIIREKTKVGKGSKLKRKSSFAKIKDFAKKAVSPKSRMSRYKDRKIKPSDENDVKVTEKRRKSLKRMDSARMIQQVARKAIVQKKRKEGRLYSHSRKISDEWEERKDDRKGSTYYVNTITNSMTKSWPAGVPKTQEKTSSTRKHWQKLKDAKNGHTYYYNKKTKETSWNEPE